MADDQTRRDGIFTPHYVKVGSADCGQRNPDHGLAYAGAWLLHFFNSNVVLSAENICLHLTLP
jgi:hypothetical protein